MICLEVLVFVKAHCDDSKKLVFKVLQNDLLNLYFARRQDDRDCDSAILDVASLHESKAWKIYDELL